MKRTVCILFAVFLLVPSLSFAIVAGDLDGNNSVTLEDVAYFMAWVSIGRPSNTEAVVDAAKGLYANAKGPMTRLPNVAYDNFYGGTSLTLNDVAIMMAWITSGRSGDFGVVRGSAISLYSPADNVYKLPATPLGDSTVPVTITGIQVDQ